jgi:uncharacterized protein YdhG (YjbR/CyaY superfamily)
MNTIDKYIAQFSPDIQGILIEIRKVIREVAPDVTEAISYKMPAFSLKGRPLVYFAVFKNHIGFYPLPEGIEAYKEELLIYKQGKGSVQFLFNKPVPFELIRKIVISRVQIIMNK